MSLYFTAAELATSGKIYPFVDFDRVKRYMRLRIFHDKRVTLDFVSNDGKKLEPLPKFLFAFVILPYPDEKVKVTQTLDGGRVLVFQFAHCFEIVHHGEPIYFWSTVVEGLVSC